MTCFKLFLLFSCGVKATFSMLSFLAMLGRHQAFWLAGTSKHWVSKTLAVKGQSWKNQLLGRCCTVFPQLTIPLSFTLLAIHGLLSVVGKKLKPHYFCPRLQNPLLLSAAVRTELFLASDLSVTILNFLIRNYSELAPVAGEVNFYKLLHFRQISRSRENINPHPTPPAPTPNNKHF